MRAATIGDASIVKVVARTSAKWNGSTSTISCRIEYNKIAVLDQVKDLYVILELPQINMITDPKSR